MSLTELLFRSWWLASLAVGIATSLITAILEFAARVSGNTALDPGTQLSEPISIIGFAVFAVGLANTWIAFALCVKRLHDRDHTGWWLVWQSLVLMLAVILIVVAIAVPSEQAPLWYALAGGASVGAFAISVWLFVEIGPARNARPQPLWPRPARRGKGRRATLSQAASAPR
jgi:uncharacterized membrane protein YhaH (DUF805 family)